MRDLKKKRPEDMPLEEMPEGESKLTDVFKKSMKRFYISQTGKENRRNSHEKK